MTLDDPDLVAKLEVRLGRLELRVEQLEKLLEPKGEPSEDWPTPAEVDPEQTAIPTPIPADYWETAE